MYMHIDNSTYKVARYLEPKMQWDSPYMWMPLEIGDGKLWLPEPQPMEVNK